MTHPIDIAHEWFETYFATIDTKKLIMTYLEDYEKYGDAFIRVEKSNNSTALVKFEEKK